MLLSSFLPLVSSAFRAADSVDVRLLFWLLFLQPSCNYAILSTTFTSEIYMCSSTEQLVALSQFMTCIVGHCRHCYWLHFCGLGDRGFQLTHMEVYRKMTCI